MGYIKRLIYTRQDSIVVVSVVYFSEPCQRKMVGRMPVNTLYTTPPSPRCFLDIYPKTVERWG